MKEIEFRTIYKRERDKRDYNHTRGAFQTCNWNP